MLRRGNNASAKFWRRVLLPVIERYRHCDIPKFFRGDAAFANPALYRVLEEEGYRYAIRLKANAVLEREIEHLLTRPVGRPSAQPKVFYHSFQYQAKSWQQSRRVVAKVEWHRGELFPRVGFIVTNLTWRSKRVVRFYNGRGTAEQWIKEGKNAVKWTKLSCRTFKDNQARLQLFALAYNLANFLRRLALPKSGSAMVADDAAGEADQDRGQGDAALEVRDVPTGRGRRARDNCSQRFWSGSDGLRFRPRCVHPVKKPRLGRIQSGFWRERRGMHGLRAENHAKTTSAEGASSVMIARGAPAWTRNRRADWKAARRIVNMVRLLPFGAYPSGAYMGNPG